MTWILRFYDDNGDEIAWVQADPYEWEVHGSDEDWKWLKVALEGKAELYPQDFDRTPEYEIEGVVLRNEPRPLDLPPKDHLRRIEDEIGGKVARTELTDE